MVTDPVGDMLAQIKNASMVGKSVVELPASKMKEAVAAILVAERFLAGAKSHGEEPKKILRLELRYVDKKPVITGLRRISKPGLRRYVDVGSIPRVVGGMGIAILSTPKGIMTGKTATKQHVGGELLCEMW